MGLWTKKEVSEKARMKADADSLVPYDELEFTDPTLGGDGHCFERRERMVLIRKTWEDPHGQIGTCGRSHNWLVHATNGITVWASVESMTEAGRLVLVRSTDDERIARSVLYA